LPRFPGYSPPDHGHHAQKRELASVSDRLASRIGGKGLGLRRTIRKFRSYLHGIFTFARQSSWKAANGLEGAALAGAAMIWLGLLAIIPGVSSWVQAANWFLSFILYAIIAWIVLFTFRFTLVAPFELWKRERIENAAKTANVDAQSQHREQVIEHDKKIAAEVRNIITEVGKRRLVSDLLNQHLYSGRESQMLASAVDFLGTVEAHFLDEELQERAKVLENAGAELLEFMGLKFFVYPREQKEPPLIFAMQPS
jgi:hypothetical protein